MFSIVLIQVGDMVLHYDLQESDPVNPFDPRPKACSALNMFGSSYIWFILCFHIVGVHVVYGSWLVGGGQFLLMSVAAFNSDVTPWNSAGKWFGPCSRIVHGETFLGFDRFLQWSSVKMALPAYIFCLCGLV